MKNKIKLALITPEHYEIARFGTERKEVAPFGFMYLAAVAESAGAEVELYQASNENYSFDFSNYDIVGFSIPSSVVYSLVRKVKENSRISEDSLLLAGGIHATLYPEQVLNELGVDVVCVGEAEETLKEILEKYPLRSFSGIKGVAYKENNEFITSESREPISDLDTIPFPARHLMPTEDIVMNNRLSDTNLKTTFVLCSRGCPSACNFCGKQEKKVRYRSGENIKNELELLKKQYGIEGFCIPDENFMSSRAKVKEICKSVKPLGLKWSSLSRIDALDAKTLEILSDSGCIELKFGMESGSQEMLDAMNKKITVEQIKKTVALTHNAGIKAKGFIIHGFPGENMKTTTETINLLKDLKDNLRRPTVFRFAPLPGSPAFKNHKEFGLHLPTNTDDIFIYGNTAKWWGSDKDKKELDASYNELVRFVENEWGNS